MNRVFFFGLIGRALTASSYNHCFQSFQPHRPPQNTPQYPSDARFCIDQRERAPSRFVWIRVNFDLHLIQMPIHVRGIPKSEGSLYSFLVAVGL